jgi:Chain length determinant protein
MAIDAKQFDLVNFLKKCVRHYIVYAAMTGLAIVAVLLYAAFSSPRYTATATIGERDSSSLSIGSTGLLGMSGLGSQLAGNGDSSTLFVQLVQVLQSNKLAQDISYKYNLLPVVFASRWDADAKEWKSSPALVVVLKRIAALFTHRPVRPHPDADDMRIFLASRMQIAKIPPLSTTAIFRAPTLMTVSLSFRDRVQAEEILAATLTDADATIRANRIRNIQARIAFLEETLPHVTLAEERTGLVAALTGQYEEMATLKADERYASIVVDPPHAPMVPSSPNVIELFIMAAFFSIAAATGIVYFLPDRTLSLGEIADRLLRADRVSRHPLAKPR